MGRQRSYAQAQQADQKGAWLECEESRLRMELASCRTRQNDDHPECLDCMNGLARVLHEQGKYAEAENLLRKVLKTRVAKMGEDISKYETQRRLAATLVAQGQTLEAERLYRQAVQGLSGMLGNAHVDALVCQRGLASVLHRNGKLQEAEVAYKRAYTGFKTRLGLKHSKTLAALEGLAAVLKEAGKSEDAELLYQKLTTVLASVYGESSPETLSAVGHHASVLRDQERLEEAEELYRFVLQGLVQHYGEEDMLSISCQNKLAAVLQQERKFAESAELFRRTVKSLVKQLGLEHPETRELDATCKAMLGLAMVLKEDCPVEAAALIRLLQPARPSSSRAQSKAPRRPNSFTGGQGDLKLDMSADFRRHGTA